MSKATPKPKQQKLYELVLAAIFSALIVVMTVTPYLGYISYGVVEITTLHIPVILGAALLGWKYGAVLGGVWGVTCMLRAFTNPLWILFTNPLISVIPRILVGVVAGLVFMLLKKTKLPVAVIPSVTSVAATLTNTVLVLSAIYIFGDMIAAYADIYKLIKSIYTTIIGVNGTIELVAGIILVPVLYKVISQVSAKYLKQAR